MKIVLLTNSKDTTPMGHGGSASFRCNLNEVLTLPKHCQMCILSSSVKDANAPKQHYVELTNLPIMSYVANHHKGKPCSIMGSIISVAPTGADSTGSENANKNWVDLNNLSEISMTNVDVKLVNQDCEVSSGLTLLTEILIGYRADPHAR